MGPERASPTSGVADPSTYDVPLDFYATYHLPYFSTWQVCERAALMAARGDRDAATRVLEAVKTKAPGRHWVSDDSLRLSAPATQKK